MMTRPCRWANCLGEADLLSQQLDAHFGEAVSDESEQAVRLGSARV